ncbi:MAG TPA: DUF1462 family protein [Bacillota bacterium]|nr:DUF1462 family protein [Bacillota bacterium]
MINIKVYGTEQRCASCVNAPSSKETASWLEAALDRIYDGFTIEYVDIYQPQTMDEKNFAQRVLDEDLWYPVIVIDEIIVSEGTPHLKDIYHKLNELGLIRKE